jgi:hypothetical protein
MTLCIFAKIKTSKYEKENKIGNDSEHFGVYLRN